MNIQAAINKCRPGAVMYMGETYESIVWLDQTQSKPSLQELEEAWLSLQVSVPRPNLAAPPSKLTLTNIQHSSL